MESTGMQRSIQQESTGSAFAYGHRGQQSPSNDTPNTDQVSPRRKSFREHQEKSKQIQYSLAQLSNQKRITREQTNQDQKLPSIVSGSSFKRAAEISMPSTKLDEEIEKRLKSKNQSPEQSYLSKRQQEISENSFKNDQIAQQQVKLKLSDYLSHNQERTQNKSIENRSTSDFLESNYLNSNFENMQNSQKQVNTVTNTSGRQQSNSEIKLMDQDKHSNFTKLKQADNNLPYNNEAIGRIKQRENVRKGISQLISIYTLRQQRKLKEAFNLFRTILDDQGEQNMNQSSQNTQNQQNRHSNLIVTSQSMDQQTGFETLRVPRLNLETLHKSIETVENQTQHPEINVQPLDRPSKVKSNQNYQSAQFQPKFARDSTSNSSLFSTEDKSKKVQTQMIQPQIHYQNQEKEDKLSKLFSPAFSAYRKDVSPLQLMTSGEDMDQNLEDYLPPEDTDQLNNVDGQKIEPLRDMILKKHANLLQKQAFSPQEQSSNQTLQTTALSKYIHQDQEYRTFAKERRDAVYSGVDVASSGHRHMQYMNHVEDDQSIQPPVSARPTENENEDQITSSQKSNTYYHVGQSAKACRTFLKNLGGQDKAAAPNTIDESERMEMISSNSENRTKEQQQPLSMDMAIPDANHHNQISLHGKTHNKNKSENSDQIMTYSKTGTFGEEYMPQNIEQVAYREHERLDSQNRLLNRFQPLLSVFSDDVIAQTQKMNDDVANRIARVKAMQDVIFKQQQNATMAQKEHQEQSQLPNLQEKIDKREFMSSPDASSNMYVQYNQGVLSAQEPISLPTSPQPYPDSSFNNSSSQLQSRRRLDVPKTQEDNFYIVDKESEYFEPKTKRDLNKMLFTLNEFQKLKLQHTFTNMNRMCVVSQRTQMLSAIILWKNIVEKEKHNIQKFIRILTRLQKANQRVMLKQFFGHLIDLNDNNSRQVQHKRSYTPSMQDLQMTKKSFESVTNQRQSQQSSIASPSTHRSLESVGLRSKHPLSPVNNKGTGNFTKRSDSPNLQELVGIDQNFDVNQSQDALRRIRGSVKLVGFCVRKLLAHQPSSLRDLFTRWRLVVKDLVAEEAERDGMFSSGAEMMKLHTGDGFSNINPDEPDDDSSDLDSDDSFYKSNVEVIQLSAVKKDTTKQDRQNYEQTQDDLNLVATFKQSGTNMFNTGEFLQHVQNNYINVVEKQQSTNRDKMPSQKRIQNSKRKTGKKFSSRSAKRNPQQTPTIQVQQNSKFVRSSQNGLETPQFQAYSMQSRGSFNKVYPPNQQTILSEYQITQVESAKKAPKACKKKSQHQSQDLLSPERQAKLEAFKEIARLQIQNDVAQQKLQNELKMKKLTKSRQLKCQETSRKHTILYQARPSNPNYVQYQLVSDKSLTFKQPSNSVYYASSNKLPSKNAIQRATQNLFPPKHSQIYSSRPNEAKNSMMRVSGTRNKGSMSARNSSKTRLSATVKSSFFQNPNKHGSQIMSPPQQPFIGHMLLSGASSASVVQQKKTRKSSRQKSASHTVMSPTSSTTDARLARNVSPQELTNMLNVGYKVTMPLGNGTFVPSSLQPYTSVGSLGIPNNKSKLCKDNSMKPLARVRSTSRTSSLHEPRQLRNISNRVLRTHYKPPEMKSAAFRSRRNYLRRQEIYSSYDYAHMDTNPINLETVNQQNMIMMQPDGTVIQHQVLYPNVGILDSPSDKNLFYSPLNTDDATLKETQGVYEIPQYLKEAQIGENQGESDEASQNGIEEVEGVQTLEAEQDHQPGYNQDDGNEESDLDEQEFHKAPEELNLPENQVQDGIDGNFIDGPYQPKSEDYTSSKCGKTSPPQSNDQDGNDLPDAQEDYLNQQEQQLDLGQRRTPSDLAVDHLHTFGTQITNRKPSQDQNQGESSFEEQNANEVNAEQIDTDVLERVKTGCLLLEKIMQPHLEKYQVEFLISLCQILDKYKKDEESAAQDSMHDDFNKDIQCDQQIQIVDENKGLEHKKHPVQTNKDGKGITEKQTRSKQPAKGNSNSIKKKKRN